MNTTPPPIVVAVGPSGSLTAVGYAVAEARRRRAPLHLVHVTTAGRDGPGPDLLAVAVAHANALSEGEVPVTGEIVSGAPIATVAEVARGATAVVVGRRPHGRADRRRTVTGGLGGRLDAPVVSVPDEWTAPEGTPRIVVGIDEPERSADVLSSALDAARSQHAGLLVFSSWWRPIGAERTPLTHVEDPTRAERLEAALRQALEPLTPTYADVPVDIDVRSARPAEALLETSQGVSLLVLGRHATVVPSGSHLGPVARAVVRDATCPVLLAAPAEHHGVGGPAGRRGIGVFGP